MGRFYPLRLQLTIFPSTYIIATAIANQTKDRFYTVDLPLIEDVCDILTPLSYNILPFLQNLRKMA